MLQKIAVSVIVPIYKAEDYIERCARSLMEQTLGGLEFIFVDDCSPDGSISKLLNVLKDYPGREPYVKIIHQEKNLGVSCARYVGYLASKGDYIAYCDSDDWVAPQMYEKLCSAAEENDADVVFCDFIKYYGEDRASEYISVLDGYVRGDKRMLLKKFLSSPWTFMWNVIVKRDVYIRMQEDESDALSRGMKLGINILEDYHLMSRLLFFAHDIMRIPQGLYYYNQTNLSSAVHSHSKEHERQSRKACMDVIDYYVRHGQYLYFAQELSVRLLNCIQSMILNKEIAEFVEIHPDKRHYIFSCQWLNAKMKIMMWCATHHCRWLVRIMLWAREVKNVVTKS